jgi:hypothetical protein
MKITIDDCPMIPGNVRQDIMIRRRDLHCYHVYAEKRMVDPRDPTHPIIRSRVCIFRPMDYRTYFEGSPQNNIDYLKAMNWTNASLVWDPCKPESQDLIKQVAAEELARRQGSSTTTESRAREGRRKASIKDIQDIVDKK